MNIFTDSGAENRFQQLTLGNDTKYAFHGTRLYNMYSILSYGLNQHLNKTGLFGEGLYFSQEIGKKVWLIFDRIASWARLLDVSLLFSPSVLSWNKSKVGDVVSCIAVCEYIDDPQFVKVRKGTEANISHQNSTSIFLFPFRKCQKFRHSTKLFADN